MNEPSTDGTRTRFDPLVYVGSYLGTTLPVNPPCTRYAPLGDHHLSFEAGSTLRRIASSRVILQLLSPEVVLRADVVAGPRNPAAGVIGATKAIELAKRHANTSALAAIICLKAMFTQGLSVLVYCCLLRDASELRGGIFNTHPL